jgi:ABC-type transport system involved in multi-copper enzyme maturation permease subunit
MNAWNDRLSPILVKELRQGIRSQLFTGSFLLIQGLLFLFGLSFVLNDSLRQEPAAGGAFFWMVIVLPLLVLVPASASQAIEKEVSGKTLELLLLTRLSSYRIVMGKWLATLVQTCLVLTSALPYVILRYFLGGVDLVSDLVTIGMLLVASALLAAISMGFWALNLSKWAKWGVVLLVLWTSPMMVLALVGPHTGMGPLPGIGIVWLYGVILAFMMLEAAAARIGPASENHDTRIRLLALLGFGAAFLFRGSTTTEILAATLALFIAIPTAVGSLNGVTKPVFRLYQPFLKGSRLKQTLLLPFAPSWPGGVAFAGIVFLLLPFLPAFRGHVGPFAALAIGAMFFFPAFVTRAVFRLARPLGFYILVLVLSSVPLYAYAFVSSVGFSSLKSLLESLGGLVPPLALTLELAHPDGYTGAAVSNTLLVLVTLVSVVGTVRAARVEWERIAGEVPA